MRVKNDWFDAEEGHGSGSWLSFGGTGEWRYHDGPGLGLPPSVDDGTLFLSRVLVVPVPGLRVNRLTDATQHSNGAEVVTFNVMLAETAEETNGSRSGVDVGNPVLLGGLPVTGWGRVDWSRFKDSGGDAIEKRPIDNISDEI